MASASNTNITSPFENAKYELVKLEKICEMYQPKTITSAEILDEGDYKVYGANGVIGYYNKYNHEFEEVALTCRGATCGTVNLTEPKSWITGNAMIVSPLNDSKVLKKFLFYVLPLADMKLVITGSAQPQITRTNLSQLKIPLPPLNIQQQIVEECQNVENQILNIQQQIQTQKTLINAVLAKCEIISAEFQNNENLQNLDLPDLPEPKNFGLISWKNVKISNQLEALDFESIKISKDKYESNGKYPIISQESNELISGYTNLENPINENLPLIIFGDHTCVFKFVDFPFFRGADGTQILKFNKEFNMKFAFYVLKTIKITNQDKYERHFKYLKEMQIPLPPIEAQEKIVQAINNIEQNINNLQTNLENLKLQQNQILQKYLF